MKDLFSDKLTLTCCKIKLGVIFARYVGPQIVPKMPQIVCEVLAPLFRNRSLVAWSVSDSAVKDDRYDR